MNVIGTIQSPEKQIVCLFRSFKQEEVLGHTIKKNVYDGARYELCDISEL